MRSAANNIRRLRQINELSGRRLAFLASISQGYLSDIETGFKTPSPRIAASIADVLNVTVADLGLKPPQTTSTTTTKRTNFLEGRRMPDNDRLEEEFTPGPMLYVPARPTVSEILATRKKMRADIVTSLQASLQSGALEIPVCADQDILLTAYESAMQEARNLLVLLTIARRECRRADENLQVVRATMKQIGERQAKSLAVEVENVNLKIEKFIEAVAQNVKNATVMEYEGTAHDDAAVIHMTLKKSFNVILQDTFLAMFGPKEVAPATTTPDAPAIADETINLFEEEDEPCVQ